MKLNTHIRGFTVIFELKYFKVPIKRLHTVLFDTRRSMFQCKVFKRTLLKRQNRSSVKLYADYEERNIRRLFLACRHLTLLPISALPSYARFPNTSLPHRLISHSMPRYSIQSHMPVSYTHLSSFVVTSFFLLQSFLEFSYW